MFCFLWSYFLRCTFLYSYVFFLFVISFIEIYFTYWTFYPFKMCSSMVLGITLFIFKTYGKYIHYTIYHFNHFKVNNSVAWSTLIILCNRSLNFRTFSLPQTESSNHQTTPLIPSLQPLVDILSLSPAPASSGRSVSVTLTDLSTSYKWNHTECVLLSLPHFPLHNVFQGLASLQHVFVFAFHLQVSEVYVLVWLAIFILVSFTMSN